MDRDAKEATKIIVECTEVAKTLGLMTFGIGRSISTLMLNPKQAAAQMVQASEQLETMSSQMLKISEQIMEWDEKRIITKVAKPIVDANHNPIAK